MFQIQNTELEFQEKLIKRVLDLQSRLKYSIKDGHIYSSLLKDLSALFKWSAKHGLMSESKTKYVQQNMNVVQNSTLAVYSTSKRSCDKEIPKCLIEMTCQNKSTLMENKPAMHSTNKRCINKQTSNLIAPDYKTGPNHHRGSPRDVIIREENEMFISSRIRNNFSSRSATTRNTNETTNTTQSKIIIRDLRRQRKRIIWSKKSSRKKRKSKRMSNRYVLVYLCKIVGKFQFYKDLCFYYDREKKIFFIYFMACKKLLNKVVTLKKINKLHELFFVT